MSGEQLNKSEKKYWLPNNFQLSAETINSIVKHPTMTIVTKDELTKELIGQDIEEEHRHEVSRTEDVKFQKMMEKEKEEKKEKRKKQKKTI